MSSTIRQAVELLAPYLESPLFPVGTRDSLEAAAAWLVPAVSLGLECRLDDTRAPVDLSQMIDVRRGEAALLAELACTRCSLADPLVRPAWARIAHFARACVIGKAPVEALWLEYDLTARLGAGSVPAVFATLGGARTADADSLYEVLCRLGAAHGDGELHASIARCVRGAEAVGARARGLCGVMLSRRCESRIMIRDVPCAAATDFLRSIGWQGDVASLQRVGAALSPVCDDIGLSLELAPSVRARVGIEIKLGRTAAPGFDEDVLDRLVSLGLCTPVRRDAALRWPGTETPATAAGRWPEVALLESLRRPPEELGMLHRILHHVKVAAGSPEPPVAKVYLGWLHAWTKPARTSIRTHEPVHV